jgi:hypothetical protein
VFGSRVCIGVSWHEKTPHNLPQDTIIFTVF